MKSETKGSVLVLAAGILWGSMGLFVRPLSAMGLSSLQISSVRMIVAALLFNIVLIIKNPGAYRIDIKDLGWFFAIGLGSVGVMTWSYFTSIQMSGMGVAAILLYTSPIWICLMARIFFKEKLTPVKLVALVLAFGGCCLVSGGGSVKLSPAGIILGLISGISYSLYSIFGAVILKKYEPMVVTTYAFTICAVGVSLIAKPLLIPGIVEASGQASRFLLLAPAMGFVTAFLTFLLYTLGLKYLDVSRAGILATVEPLVATLLGIIVYKESLSILSGLGIAAIFAANILLNIKTSEN